MTISAGEIQKLIDDEMKSLKDDRVLSHIRSLLIKPTPEYRDWDYGEPGQQYLCWIVLDHPASGSGIAYCEEGFGPSNPWGLIGTDPNKLQNMGMDSQWFPSFLDAYFDSFASTELPIWCIFQTDEHGVYLPISKELEWYDCWDQIMKLREKNPDIRYDCRHTII